MLGGRKTIGVLTTGRQDWGILRSTCKRIAASTQLDLRLFVGGMGCDPAFGNLEQIIEGEGFQIAARAAWLEGLPAGLPTHAEASRALALLGDVLGRVPVDALVLVGDRYETLMAATAATLLRIPIVHLHGGEETVGAFDNAIRHAITKLSHLHLTSHPIYAQRVVEMGELPGTVHVVGAPGLDNLRRADLASRSELEATLGISLERPLVVVTVHPSTLAERPMADVEATCAAMRAIDATYVVTLPNTDPGNAAIRERLLEAVSAVRGVASPGLGERRFWGLLRVADAVLGNSSSGVIEAPALGLPTINVGDRQRGRLRADSIIDVPPEGTAVTEALRRALSPGFRDSLAAQASPLGHGMAGDRIVEILVDWAIPVPPIKEFAR